MEKRNYVCEYFQSETTLHNIFISVLQRVEHFKPKRKIVF